MLHFVTPMNCSLYWKTIFREENHLVCLLNWEGYTQSVKTRVSDNVRLVAAAAPGRLLLGAGAGAGASAWLRKTLASVQQMSWLGIREPGPQ